MARFSNRKNKSILCCEMIERRRQGHDYFAKDLVSKLVSVFWFRLLVGGEVSKSLNTK
jgi:hypothetical protein